MTSHPPKPSFKTVARRERVPIAVTPDQLCRIGPLREGQRLPLLVEAAAPGLDLAAWLAEQREVVETRLREHGGVLFRGFGVSAPSAFEACIRTVSGELVEYTYRSTPRTKVSGRIYTSTEYPPDRRIPLHNEMSYSRSWPLKIWFCAVTTAAGGGETPIADSRAVYRRMPPAIRDEFARKQVMYVRNYGEGVDLPWQDVFQTENKADVERVCRESGIEWEWRDGDRLRTRQVCQAVAAHPHTGDLLWFNQAHLFHVASLDQASRELLQGLFTEDELPRHVFFGDGTRITPDVIAEINRAYDAETIVFPWQAGDVLLLDNMLTAHGRSPFEGPRKVLAGMAERWGGAGAVVQ